MSSLRTRYRLWRHYEDYYTKSGAPKKCLICDGTEFSTECLVTVGWEISEYSEFCTCCNTQAAYWSYGNYDRDPPMTFCEVIGLRQLGWRINARIRSLTRTLTGKGESPFPPPPGM